MKKLLSTVSLIFSFVVICICTFLGMRLGPMLWRGLAVFVLTYIIALASALVVFVVYLSPKYYGPSAGKVRTEGKIEIPDSARSRERREGER